MTLSIVSPGVAFSKVAAVIPPTLTGALSGIYRFAGGAGQAGLNLLYGGAVSAMVGSPTYQSSYASFLAGSSYLSTGIADAGNLSYLICARAPNAAFTTAGTAGPTFAGSWDALLGHGSAMVIEGGSGTGPGGATVKPGLLVDYQNYGSAITSITYNGTTTVATLASSIIVPVSTSYNISGNSVSNFNGTFTVTASSAGSITFTPFSFPASGTTGTGGTGAALSYSAATVATTGASGQTAAITSILYTTGVGAVVTLANPALVLPQGGSIVITGNSVSNFNQTATMTSTAAGTFTFTPTSPPTTGTTGTGGTGTYTTPGAQLWKMYGGLIVPGTGLTVYNLTDGLSTAVANTLTANTSAANTVYIGSTPSGTATFGAQPADIAYAAIGTGLTYADLQALTTLERPRLASVGISI
jgi:hypothetical protein